MKLARLIPEAALVRLWRIYPHTIIDWRRKGLIRSSVQEPHIRGGAFHYYTLDDIDAIHRAVATGFTPETIPSTAELLRMERGLLTTHEACEILGQKMSVVKTAIATGRLPAFRIGHNLRLPAALVIERTRTDHLVHPNIARKVLCISGRNAIRDLCRAGYLQREQIIGKGQLHFIVRSSLMQLVEGLVCPHITAEEWWGLCIQDTEPAISQAELMRRYHLSASRTVNPDREAGKLLYIRTVGGNVSYPAWAVSRYIKGRSRLPNSTTAALFAFTQEEAAKMAARHKLCPLLHGGAQNVCPSRHCITEYIKLRRSTQSLEPDEWFRYVLDDGLEPITLQALVEMTALCTEDDVKEALQRGQLRGIWLPESPAFHNKRYDRRAAILRTDAIAFRRWWERQLEREW